LPLQTECHPNVDKWVEQDTGATAVRGWVTYADFGDAIVVIAHSVVKQMVGFSTLRHWATHATPQECVSFLTLEARKSFY
jgi:hypothetical protein